MRKDYFIMRKELCSALVYVALLGYASGNLLGNINLDCIEVRKDTKCGNETLAKFDAPGENGKDLKTHFYLFTRQNRDNAEFLNKCGGGLAENTYFNPKCKIIMYFHGYLGTLCTMAEPREVKDQLLFKGNYNVILIDYNWAALGDYVVAIQESYVVAKHIAFVIKNIMKQTGVELKKFHLAGHSLGAHLAGAVGELFKSPKIGRITGVDPGLPSWNYDSPVGRLDRTDAEWVDVIHTSDAPCLPYFGDYRQIGHADFYVNGGKTQLSCYTESLNHFLKGDILYGLVTLLPTLCFHAQALQYFKVSINACNCQFIGVECDSYESFEAGRCRQCGQDGTKCAVMGFDWDKYPRQKGNHSYYLDTGLFCPYCKIDERLDLQGFKKYVNNKCGCRKPSCFPDGTENRL